MAFTHLSQLCVSVLLVFFFGEKSQSQDQGCSTTSQGYLWALKEYENTLTSPNYPGNYLKSTSCTWSIKSPPGYAIKVTFSDFFLDSFASVERRCSMSDFLKFCDGSCDSGVILGKYCGTLHPKHVYSLGNILSIEFDSRSLSSTARGFKINFKAVPEAEIAPLCLWGKDSLKNDNLQIQGAEGTIYSPNYPLQYPDGMQCTWLLTVPQGKRVKLIFEEFDLSLSIGIECSVDYISIRDGDSPDDDEVDKFCNGEEPADTAIYSSGRHMWVRFVSIGTVFDMYRTSGGFKAHFEAAEKSYKGEIIGVVAGCIVLLLIALCCVCCRRSKKAPKNGPPSPPPPSLADPSTTVFAPFNPPLSPSAPPYPPPTTTAFAPPYPPPTTTASAPPYPPPSTSAGYPSSDPLDQLPPPPSYYSVVYDRGNDECTAALPVHHT